MYCSHQDFGVCDNCWSRQKADDRHAARIDADARRRSDEEARRREREQRRYREQAAASAAGPSPLDRYAARVQAQGAAKQAAKATARSAQPFNLFWYERVAVVLGALLLLGMLVAALPTWLLLLVLLGVGVAVRRYRDRPLLAVVRVVGRFVRGERRSG